MSKQSPPPLVARVEVMIVPNGESRWRTIRVSDLTGKSLAELCDQYLGKDCIVKVESYIPGGRGRTQKSYLCGKQDSVDKLRSRGDTPPERIMLLDEGIKRLSKMSTEVLDPINTNINVDTWDKLTDIFGEGLEIVSFGTEDSRITLWQQGTEK